MSEEPQRKRAAAEPLLGPSATKRARTLRDSPEVRRVLAVSHVLWTVVLPNLAPDFMMASRPGSNDRMFEMRWLDAVSAAFFPLRELITKQIFLTCAPLRTFETGALSFVLQVLLPRIGALTTAKWLVRFVPKVRPSCEFCKICQGRRRPGRAAERRRDIGKERVLETRVRVIEKSDRLRYGIRVRVSVRPERIRDVDRGN